MTDYLITKALPEHVDELVQNMRAEDRAEVEATGDDPKSALLHSIERSTEAWTAFADGRVICMFGIAPPTILSDMAVPWLLTAEEMPKHKRIFLSRSRQVVEDWRQQYTLMVNYVDARYAKALRWLEWLGFSMGPDEILGPTGTPFRRVEMRS